METKYYVGLDVHKESTTYAVRDRLGNILAEGTTATLYSDIQPALVSYLESAQIGLEASTSYYTLYKELLKNHYSVKVANTVQMRQLIAKNDTLDARRLAEMLRLGSFPTAYIPDDKIQYMRSLVNLRHSMMEEKTRCNLRIQAFVDRCGLVMPQQEPFGVQWRRALMQYVGTGKAGTDIRYEYDHYQYLEQKAKQIDEEMKGYAMKYWPQEYGLLQSITGIGPIISCYIIANVLPISRFPSKRSLRRYIGVVPADFKSGGKSTPGKIPKTSSRGILRWGLVQASNAIAKTKTKTKLGRRYNLKKKQKNAGKAKIAVAASLSDIIYEVLTKKKEYVSA